MEVVGKPKEVLTDEDGVSERDLELEVSVDGVVSFSLLVTEASDDWPVFVFLFKDCALRDRTFLAGL